MSAIAIGVGIGAALIAAVLTRLIGLITNLCYYGRWSDAFSAPSTAKFGAWTVFIPIGGAVLVGLMARYGAAAIRGHGIPEVMERVLFAGSRISPKVMFLKPISAAIAIGTGGPFGAEGPIIATGGALGSLIGQFIHVTADERKILLAAGAAAGMAATFGSPVSAVLLAVELLLFEYRPRSLVPVALASAVAAVVRNITAGSKPVFASPTMYFPTLHSLLAYVVLGALIGVFAVFTTRFVYWIEDMYEELPIHWMWWPVVGAIAVGLIGLVDERTLGVGYSNIQAIISGDFVGRALIVLVVLKFLSWAIYLGSGTSGGTLAPLFTVGGGLGAALGELATRFAPGMGVDVHVAALVGMAAIFAGASHALLTSVVFAFETTRQPMGLLPLLAGCSAAYLVALLMHRSSIMTEKLFRRGAEVRTEYSADFLGQVKVRSAATKEVVTITAGRSLGELRAWISTRTPDTTHQGFPVVDTVGSLLGVITRRDLLDPSHDDETRVESIINRHPAVVYERNTLREAADHMVREGVGRLPVVSDDDPTHVVAIISRSDILAAHQMRLDAEVVEERPAYGVRRMRRRSGAMPKVK
jgi:H+/Cl- antiporter ClcA/CBS domain-containing protein